MRFTSLTLLSAFLITFLSAIPAPDKYAHFRSTGCPTLAATSCRLLSYCRYHRQKGDLFGATDLKSRDASEPENLDLNLTATLSPSLPLFFTTREFDVNWKRINIDQCGLLSNVAKLEVSNQFKSLVAGVLYDIIIDYPYNGATGGVIGIFAQVATAGVVQISRLGSARTGYGGVRFTFSAPLGAAWYQVLFLGDNVATAAVTYFITRH